jgi:hypothetical protein
MNKKYFIRDHLKAFDNALRKGYSLDGVMYMESLRDTQDDGKTYFFDIFKHKVSRQRFLIRYQHD